METLHQLINFLIHIDVHLTTFVAAYGIWTYALLFLIIFCETGLVVTPFFPGDSLLFAAGAITATTADSLNIHVLFVLLVMASILGNSLNYFLGNFLGPRVFSSQHSWFFNKNYLLKAHQFYTKFGGKTLIIARFMPIIRTFAPFVAGIAKMNPSRFQLYNVSSALLWVGSLLYLSFWFGNLPLVKNNFAYVVMGIIVLSLLPPIIELVRHRCANQST